MIMIIVEIMHDTYNQQLVCFMHYLYNNHDHLIVYKDAIDQEDDRDKAVEISHSNDKKRKRRRKGKQTILRTSVSYSSIV